MKPIVMVQLDEGTTCVRLDKILALRQVHLGTNVLLKGGHEYYVKAPLHEVTKRVRKAMEALR